MYDIIKVNKYHSLHW